jgi:hypothetical protein
MFSFIVNISKKLMFFFHTVTYFTVIGEYVKILLVFGNSKSTLKEFKIICNAIDKNINVDI